MKNNPGRDYRSSEDTSGRCWHQAVRTATPEYGTSRTIPSPFPECESRLAHGLDHLVVIAHDAAAAERQVAAKQERFLKIPLATGR
jgi:hypothetical protein